MKICGEVHLIPDRVRDLDILYIRLEAAMETECAALKGHITNKRRKEAHQFILSCSEKLMAINEEYGYRKRVPDNDQPEHTQQP